jgi:6-phosphogluconate dehydrogenase
MVEKFCSITEDYGDFDLFLHSEIIKTIKGKELSWRRCCANSIQYGIPVPAISSSISFFDTMSSEQLPSNLIQAQRDFFGFHGFYKVDDPTGRVYHLEAI